MPKLRWEKAFGAEQGDRAPRWRVTNTSLTGQLNGHSWRRSRLIITLNGGRRKASSDAVVSLSQASLGGAEHTQAR